MRYTSPLRYPGGKAGLAGFLGSVIRCNGIDGCTYAEPYAGGAGAALSLLENGTVSALKLNDADRRIYAFWESLFLHGERFAERILAVPLCMDEWRRQREICANPEKHDNFTLGFAAFYMNRCNRSGVITGAGPIGGMEQSGKWKLDVRFYRDSLAERVLRISRMSGQIEVYCMDAIEFMKSAIPKGRGRSSVFVYLDPPYVGNGQRLYLNAYKPGDHRHLAAYLYRQRAMPWLVSYDNHPLIRQLYSGHRIDSMPIRYTLQSKRSASELIVTPWHLEVAETPAMMSGASGIH